MMTEEATGLHPDEFTTAAAAGTEEALDGGGKAEVSLQKETSYTREEKRVKRNVSMNMKLGTCDRSLPHHQHNEQQGSSFCQDYQITFINAVMSDASD
ncbi:hypothetical protein UY3_13569 [Chelonia mydas]|uniref:Uncharacterized protein n=1 Tax=Chelonia mydas TaxID=8469 RepID=M7B1P3_CHEMY|nr:hypothetical protein UY3_13569 [Chelonia mydas]